MSRLSDAEREQIRQEVASWPPPTTEQAANIAELLSSGVMSHERAAA